MTEDIPPPPEFTERFPDLVARVTKLVGHVPRTRDLKSPHPAIAKLLAGDVERHEKWRQSSYSSFYNQPYYISPYEQRRLRLIDAIFKAMDRAGMVSEVPRHENPREFTVRVSDSSVSFILEKPNSDEERTTWRAASEARRPASEPMRLKIGWWSEKPEGLVLEWTDSSESLLESLLSQIVVNLLVAAEMRARIGEHHWYESRVRRKEALIEAERQRQKEAVRKERERQRRLEKSRIEKLLQEAMSLRLANDIRHYVAAVNARNAESQDPLSEPEMAKWSHWALEQANRVDPVCTGAFLQPVPEPVEDESAPIRTGHAHTPASYSDRPAPAWHPNRWYTRLHR